MTKPQGLRELTDEQCIDLAKQIEHLCKQLYLGTRMPFNSAGYALIDALKIQATNLRIVLEIIYGEKRRNTNDREN